MWLLHPVPRTLSIALATSVFSPPLSERTLDGQPHSLTAALNKPTTVSALNKPTTVSALLLSDALRYTTLLDYPSMPPCTTILHLIGQCKPSMCQKQLDAGTLYTLRCIVTLCCVSTKWLDTRTSESCTLLWGTMMFKLRRCPYITVPLFGNLMRVVITLSSSASLSWVYLVLSTPSSLSLLQSVVLETIKALAICSQVYLSSRNISTYIRCLYNLFLYHS